MKHFRTFVGADPFKTQTQICSILPVIIIIMIRQRNVFECVIIGLLQEMSYKCEL